MYSRRYFSEPEICAVKNAVAVKGDRAPYGYYRFLAKPLPEVFRDSTAGTVVRAQIYNQYEFFRFGPPFIPIIPGRDGYGYSMNRINRPDSAQLRTVMVQLEIDPGGADSVMFDPYSFFMVSRKTNNKSYPVSVNGLPDRPMVIHCKESTSLKITFSPGMQVQDRPILFLKSLLINGREFHSEGIPFSIGKKSFYAVMITVNG